MSAPDKEPQPLGSTSGKRGYIRTCVRCGVTLYGVGRRAKYCPECRAEVYRERARDYKARNPDKVRAAYERRRAAAWTPVHCKRCGCEIPNATHRQKWCPNCIRAIKSQQSRQSYIRRHKADTAQAKPKEEPLELLSNVAIWAGISYGELMLKSPATREAPHPGLQNRERRQAMNRPTRALLAVLAAVLLALATWHVRQMCALVRVVDSIRP